MRVWQATWVIPLAWVLGSLTAGCGPGAVERAPISVEQLSIEEIASILRAYQKGQKPPPKGLKDLLPMQAAFPTAVQALKNKEVLVYWGAGLSDASGASSTVLAYHKDVPEKGGEVLMQDGTARKMTADEFKAATKAGT
jgi:hypothetical protein